MCDKNGVAYSRVFCFVVDVVDAVDSATTSSCGLYTTNKVSRTPGLCVVDVVDAVGLNTLNDTVGVRQKRLACFRGSFCRCRRCCKIRLACVIRCVCDNNVLRTPGVFVVETVDAESLYEYDSRCRRFG